MERDLGDAYALDMYAEELAEWRQRREAELQSVEDLVVLTEDSN